MDSVRAVLSGAMNEPVKATLIVAGGAVVGAVAFPIAASALGFGAAGVAGGSIAAGLQSGIGNVVAGSGFAYMQSIAATGAVAKVGAVAGAGVAATGKLAAKGWRMVAGRIWT